jgi:hypothetical protein
VERLEIELEHTLKHTKLHAETLGDADACSQTQEKRQSQLYVFMRCVHQVLYKKPKPTVQNVWREIQNNYATHDTDKIIEEVDGKQILW